MNNYPMFFFLLQIMGSRGRKKESMETETALIRER